jgi:hypothetical protein
MGIVAGCTGNFVFKKGKIHAFLGGLTGECFPHFLRHPYKMIAVGGMVILLSSMTTDAELCWFILERELSRGIFLLLVRKGLMAQ